LRSSNPRLAGRGRRLPFTLRANRFPRSPHAPLRAATRSAPRGEESEADANEALKDEAEVEEPETEEAGMEDQDDAGDVDEAPAGDDSNQPDDSGDDSNTGSTSERNE
jgi:hypothetical protein